MRIFLSVSSVENTVASRRSHIAVITKTVAGDHQLRHLDPMPIVILTGTAVLTDKEEASCAWIRLIWVCTDCVQKPILSML